jgi:hypothetical protein
VCVCVRARVSMNGCMSVVHCIHVLLANIQYNFIHNDLLLPTFVTVHSTVSDSNICEIYMALSLYSTSLNQTIIATASMFQSNGIDYDSTEQSFSVNYQIEYSGTHCGKTVCL